MFQSMQTRSVRIGYQSVQSPPVLIVLNGASSSGKTRTAHAIQSLLGANCMITGLDDVLERVRPFGMTTSTTLGSLRRSTRIIWFQLTDGRLKLFKQLHREVVSLYEAGYNVIVDTTLMDRRALLDAAQCFAPLQGFFTGLKPPLEISEAWEIRRVDRPPGQVRKHYDLVHAHHTYDLLLDPSKMTSEECARLILQSCESIMPTAFQRLLQQSD